MSQLNSFAFAYERVDFDYFVCSAYDNESGLSCNLRAHKSVIKIQPEVDKIRLDLYSMLNRMIIENKPVLDWC